MEPESKSGVSKIIRELSGEGAAAPFAVLFIADALKKGAARAMMVFSHINEYNGFRPG